MTNKFMRRAIEISKKGRGYVNPNPLVGAVIVKDGIIIGEGYHEKYGGPHAEVNAFNNATEDVSGATLYVTLEPCSHYGKTPPCVNLIIEKKIAKVIVGMVDPNPIVSGRGIEKLINNGIEAITGILEDDIKRLNEIFIKYITTKKPFCIIKTAMTLDGKIASYSGDSKWITGESSRNYVHNLRHNVSGILVGIGTVITDNPYLTTRLNGEIGKDSIRIIIDTTARIPLSSNVLSEDLESKIIIATTKKANIEKINSLKNKGAEVIVTPILNDQVDLRYLFEKLGELGIDSVLIEGGSEINFSALEAGIVDKVIAFIAPKIIGGRDSKTSVGGKGIKYMKDAILLEGLEMVNFGKDIMVTGYIQRSGN